MSEILDDKERASRMLKVLSKTPLASSTKSKLVAMAERGECDALLAYVHARFKDMAPVGTLKKERGDASLESLYQDLLWAYRGGRVSFRD